MPLDASIPLGLTPVRINTPFENLDQVLKTRRSEQLVRQGEIEARQAERSMADQDALRAIWQQYGDNPEEALKRTKAINPQLGLKMEQEMTQAAIVNMRLQDEQLEREERQHDKHLLRLGSIPKGDDELYQAARGLAVKDDPDMDQILPKTYTTDQDVAQLERAMETGKEARQVISQRRQELNRLRDDADRKANQAAVLDERQTAREERMAYLQEALTQRKESADQLAAYRQELLELRKATEARIGQTAAQPKMLSPTAESNIINRLSNQWTSAQKPIREIQRQVDMMDAGLEAAKRGNVPQGTEAVLQTFLKVLDPNSVVREGEFWRLKDGQSLINRARVVVQRIQSGGFVPVSELEKYAQLGHEILEGQRSYNANIRERIGKTADRYSIPRELVIDEVVSGSQPEAAPSSAPPSAASGAAPKEGQRRQIRGGGTAEYRGGKWIRVQ